MVNIGIGVFAILLVLALFGGDLFIDFVVVLFVGIVVGMVSMVFIVMFVVVLL